MNDESQDSWVEVRLTHDETEAAIIQGLLEENGIPCRVDSSRVSQLPVTFGKMGELRLFVPEEDLGRAEALLLESEPDGAEQEG
ncbi:MAG: DUF2007 domain-containing protein [Nitrospirae bacterium]|nr:DUF2007 domain-containing protein [Nitrospirota bacterium]